MMDAAVVATLLTRSFLDSFPTRTHPDSLQTRRSPSGVFGLPELHYYSFWHQMLLLLLLSPAACSLQAGTRPVWHLAVTLGATTGFSAAELLDANVQMTREEERERERERERDRSQKIVPLMRLFLVGRRRLSV